MAKEIFNLLETEIQNLHSAGLFHDEYKATQKDRGKLQIDNKDFIDLTSRDFLGLYRDDRIIRASQEAISLYGPGTGSYRFVAGTEQIHQELEKDLASFLEKDDSAIFTSLYQANLGLFESLVNHQDYIFCHLSCHPSIIDGVQLSKARKQYWGYGDYSDLEDQLKRSPRARFRFIITEGVFANDGRVMELQKICDLAQAYNAIVVVHDTFGLGLLGPNGKGSAEYDNVLDRVDVITGAFSGALSGVEVGFVAGNKDLIRWLKQKSKPYVFSMSPSPALVASARAAIEIIQENHEKRSELSNKVQHFRDGLTKAGLRIVKSDHPIVAVLTNDAVKTQKLVDKLYSKNVFVTGLCYPAVPKGFARVVCHVTVNQTYDDLDQVIKALS